MKICNHEGNPVVRIAFTIVELKKHFELWE